MRVVHLSTRERYGGAAVAAHRLHAALRKSGVSSRMLVQGPTSDDPTVVGGAGPAASLLSRARRVLDRLPLALYPDRDGRDFSVAWVPGLRASTVRRLEPDLVHVHWIGRGFLRPGTLAALGVPLVWTLHDMWAFTGGCHYAAGCRRYEEACGACPALGSGRERDLSRWCRRRKERALEETELTLVAPSRWMAERARRSSLLGGRRIEVIPNGLDLERFRPVERAAARGALGLPEGRRLLAFGALGADMDPRKGYRELLEALGHLRSSSAGREVELVTFGGRPGREEAVPGLSEHRLGMVHDEATLALVYGAADLFVAPSLEDNLPNTVLEALACGTPVVAFAAGGIPELVEPGRTGELVPVGDTRSLARALAGLLSDDGSRERMGERARERAVREHGVALQADRCRRLYETVAGL